MLYYQFKTGSNPLQLLSVRILTKKPVKNKSGFILSVSTSSLCDMKGALYLRGARLSLAVHPFLLC